MTPLTNKLVLPYYVMLIVAFYKFPSQSLMKCVLESLPVTFKTFHSKTLT